MALQTINTIQSGAKATYSDNYIKQALSNLGQRTGAKGDSIINQDFKILDIKIPLGCICIFDIFLLFRIIEEYPVSCRIIHLFPTKLHRIQIAV
jgi:hypothetical protein